MTLIQTQIGMFKLLVLQEILQHYNQLRLLRVQEQVEIERLEA